MVGHRFPRLASFLLLARAGIDMDLMARARVLESALGMTPWSWARNPRGFLLEGPRQYPDVDPQWFSNRDTGLADAVFKGTNAVLRSDTGEATAEEVAQNMIMGLSIGGGKKESDVFGDLGKKNKSTILSGSKGPGDLKSTVFGWAKSRALDVVRKKKRRPEEVNDEALQGVSTMDFIESNPNEVMLSLISGPAGQKFRAWIYETIQRKATEVQKVIIEVSLDHMARTGDWPSANSIRDKVIELKGSDISLSKINQHRRKVEQLLADEMESNPKVLDWAERYLDLADLGYGRGTLRAAAERVALRAQTVARVADRFLLARGYQPTDDEAADISLASWQRSVGDAAVKALKGFPQGRVTGRWSVDSRDSIHIPIELPPLSHLEMMDRYDYMESVEFREMKISDWVRSALQKFMGQGSRHSPGGLVWLSKDDVYAHEKSSDGSKWVVEITPHAGR